jgi:hypothetical protein
MAGLAKRVAEALGDEDRHRNENATNLRGAYRSRGAVSYGLL